MPIICGLKADPQSVRQHRVAVDAHFFLPHLDPRRVLVQTDRRRRRVDARRDERTDRGERSHEHRASSTRVLDDNPFDTVLTELGFVEHA